jgi:hypothetical protein
MKYRHPFFAFALLLSAGVLACSGDAVEGQGGTGEGGDEDMRSIDGGGGGGDEDAGGGADLGGDFTISGEDCTNDIDDDDDGDIDCDDDDCSAHQSCAEVTSETNCSDDVDDDGDGRVDCDDPDCNSDVACDDGGGGAEDCDNGIDDDGDGLRDCYDGDCSGDPACAADVAEDCFNGIDDDGDGARDCDDADCEAVCSGGGGGGGGEMDMFCEALCGLDPTVGAMFGCDCSGGGGGGGGGGGETICDDDIDNDSNGFTDCADIFSACCDDAACAGDPSCP